MWGILIMINIRGQIQRYYDTSIETTMRKLLKSGSIKKFDKEFYSQFDGMLYNLVPVEYYLKKMSMGRCYDASVVLALALGKSREDVFVCRGNLRNAGWSINGTSKFGHGWVETDDMVYDTTWKIITSKKNYYKIFGAKPYSKRTNLEFFKDCEHMSDFNIHDKSYYEQNFVPMAYTTLIQLYSCAELEILSGDEKRKMVGEKLKSELPDMELVYEQYKIAEYNLYESIKENQEIGS